MINWLRTPIHRGTDRDVAIRKNKTKGKLTIVISFSGTIAAEIRTRRYVDIGIDGDRLYFRLDENRFPGSRKASDYSSTGYSICYTTDSVVTQLEQFAGEYAIKAEGDLYYIEKGEA